MNTSTPANTQPIGLRVSDARFCSATSSSTATARATTASPTSGARATLRNAQSARARNGSVTDKVAPAHPVLPAGSHHDEHPEPEQQHLAPDLVEVGRRPFDDVTQDVAPLEQLDREQDQCRSVRVHERGRTGDRAGDEELLFAALPRRCAVEPTPGEMQPEV